MLFWPLIFAFAEFNVAIFITNQVQQLSFTRIWILPFHYITLANSQQIYVRVMYLT